MRKIKKIISIILIICLSLCSSVLVFAEKTSSEEAFAEYVVGGNRQNIDMFQYWNGTITEKGGRPALERSPGDGSTPYILIGVSDDFIYEPEGEQAVIISVEYFDEGNGCFTITYDGIHNIPYGRSKTLMTNSPDIVQLEDTKQWKTHEFYIDDAKFTNEFQGDADFRIALWAMEMGMSPDKVYFGSVKIEKTYMRDPIRIKGVSDCYGNIFGQGEQKLTLEMKNVLNEPVIAKFNCHVVNQNGEIIDETEFMESFEESFEAKQTLSKEIDLTGIKKFDLYTLKADIIFNQDIGEGMKEYNSYAEVEFSFVNKPATANKQLYVSTHGLEAGIDNTVKIARYAGFSGIRDDITWRTIETTRGKYNVPEDADILINRAAEENLGSLIILAYENELYDNGLPPHTDEGIKAYANYCAYMAKKYKGIVDTFEIWNEYNISLFNKGNFGGDVYARMLKAAYTAIKEVNPDATVVGMCSAGTDLEYMKEVFDNGGYDYMDVISFHPYDWSGAFRIGVFTKAMRDVKELIEQYGKAKPMWITEFGMTSAECSTGIGDEGMQAAYAVQMYAVSQEDNLCERIYWYCLQNTGLDKTEQEHMFGLVRAEYDTYTPHAARPLMLAMAGMNSFIGDAKFKDCVKLNDDIYTYLMEKPNGEQVIVMWSVNGSEVLGLDLGCSEIEIFDIYTNTLGKLKSNDGIYNFTPKPYPVYIKGNFTKFKNEVGSITQNVARMEVVPSDTNEIVFYDKEKRNLTVEAEIPDGITIVSNDGMKNGEAKLLFKVIQDEDDYSIKVKLRDGQNTVGMSEIDVDVVDLIDIEFLGTSQVAANDFDHLQAKIKVKNNANNTTISGTCEFKDTNNSDKCLETAKFFGLKPKEDVTLYFNLPTMIKKRTMDVSAKVETTSGLTASLDTQLGFTAAKYTGNTPAIDGKIESGEWKGMWLTADEERNIKEIVNWGGTSDLSYDCNMMWDDKNLYIAAIVTDDVFCQNEEPGNIWRGDSLQFALKDYDKGIIVNGNGVDEDFTEIGVALIKTGPVAYQFKSMYGSGQARMIENENICISRNGGKTIYEIAIPWSEIFYEGYSPKANTDLGFSLLINDNDGFGRRGWLEYSEGIGQVKNALLFGLLHLAE